jgi:hypothetical protein
MKSAVLVCLTAVLALAAAAPDFSGTYVYDASKSKGMGGMGGMQATLTVKQSADVMTLTTVSSFNGQEQKHETRYDLKSKPVPNESAMGDKAETVSKWDGAKLLTTWTSEGAIAGSKVVRNETRYLSADGKTMTVETVRGNNTFVMVYNKK